VKWSGIRLAQARQGINRVSPQSVNRLKEPQDFVRFDSFLERFQLLRALPQLDIFDVNGAVLMHREHQSLDAAFAGVVVFHLGARCSIITGKKPWRRHASITAVRCSGKSSAVLPIIARLCCCITHCKS
jgi:hypothetical protein